MSAVIASNRDTVGLVRAMGRSDVKLQSDAAVTESFLALQPRWSTKQASSVRLLWVGTIRPRKGMSIALNALAKVQCSATLTIVGPSPNEGAVRQMIADLGLTERVQWAGRRLPWSEVREFYLKHDALLFTSVRESCGVQLLEAMALGMPVITLDLHGARDFVPDQAGIKVAVTTPGGVVRDLAAAVDRFAQLSPEERNAMSEVAWTFAEKNTWTARAEEFVRLYEQLVKANGSFQGQGGL